MDREEIRLKLGGYRPELYADDDPMIAEALAAAKQDSELKAWLEEEISFDRGFSASLGKLAPPPGALDQLLAQATAIRTERSPSKPWWLAAAAILLACSLFGAKFLLFPPPVQFAHTETKTIPIFRKDMAKFANSRFILDETFENLEESERWLEKRGFPTYHKVPSQIVQFRGIGCKAINWDGTKVGLICFTNGKGQTVHLFVVEASVFKTLSPATAPLEQVIIHRHLETGGWTADDMVFLLVASGPDVQVGNLL